MDRYQDRDVILVYEREMVVYEAVSAFDVGEYERTTLNIILKSAAQ